MRYIALLASGLFFFQCCQVVLAEAAASKSKPTIHLIAAAKTTAVKIGSAFAENNKQVEVLFKNIAINIGMEWDPTEIIEANYSCENIIKAIDALVVNDDDVIIFYHSGHGLSPKTSLDDKKNSDFPSLQCENYSYQNSPYDNDQVETLPNLQKTILPRMQNKGARLTFVIADSCNEPVPGVLPKGGAEMAGGEDPTLLQQKMFRKFRGYILMASSTFPEKSWYPTAQVGFFTAQLINAINNPGEGDDKLLWDRVLEQARRRIDLQKAAIERGITDNNMKKQAWQTPILKPQLSYTR